MFYIKLDKDNTPINHPMTGQNLKELLEVAYLDNSVLEKYGYAKFEHAKNMSNGITIHTTDYFLGDDGIVRNRAILREFTQDELTDTFIRRRRSYLLAASDWTQAADSPLTVEKREEWATYRQALRDLTSLYPTVQTADEVVWPIEPSKT